MAVLTVSTLTGLFRCATSTGNRPPATPGTRPSGAAPAGRSPQESRRRDRRRRSTVRGSTRRIPCPWAVAAAAASARRPARRARRRCVPRRTRVAGRVSRMTTSSRPRAFEQLLQATGFGVGAIAEMLAHERSSSASRRSATVRSGLDSSNDGVIGQPVVDEQASLRLSTRPACAAPAGAATRWPATARFRSRATRRCARPARAARAAPAGAGLPSALPMRANCP